MARHKELHCDIETYASIDLNKAGVYRYVESPDFEILLFGYSFDGEPVTVIDLACGESLPIDVFDALTDDTVIKVAHNANFERVCLSRYLGLPTGEYLDASSWHCTMVWSATLGLPLSLKGIGAVLGLEKQKIEEGKELIRYFCRPCLPTKANDNRIRNLPEHAYDKWEAFKEYNKRDVETEMEIQEKLSRFPVPDNIWEQYFLDQEINDRGIRIDMTLVKSAIAMDNKSHDELSIQLQNLTAIENPNSVAQMKEWLAGHDLFTDTLGKKDIVNLLKTAPEDIRPILMLRQQLAKTSVKKYIAMENAVCSDDRARGMFQFGGATRTLRWAGKIVQLQNLPQNHMLDLDEARALVRSGNYEAVKTLYDSVPDVLSELIRTAFIPAEGKIFYVADFSAIEARVIAWLAGELWRQDVFMNGGDIYCASASQMFHVPVIKNGVNGHLRQKGKIAELALGYGGSVGALKAMGAMDMGIPEAELKPLVNAWRAANPSIVKLWWAVDKAAMTAVKEKSSAETHGIRFRYQSGFLFITLPSGRNLAYVKPRIGENKFGSPAITYEGIGITKKWERQESYGPKFVENIVQATARDILCYAMQTLRCCAIVGHVHDELIIEASPAVSLEVLCKQMGRTPPWAEGLILRADGFTCTSYRKD
ncbi:MAG: DNA polymerase [Christensenellales bacterium]|jgi:DNA polymerase